MNLTSSTNSSTPTTQTKPQPPWYKQFWPWFIIFFPASAVVAGIATVIIAVQNQDTLVEDNWYKDGLAINQRLDKQNLAIALNISGHVTVNRDNNQLALTVKNVDGLEHSLIDISFIHPTQPEKDAAFQAFYTPKGFYVAQLPSIPKGYFHLRIGGENIDWQLNGGINFSNDVIDAIIHPR